MPAFGGPWTLEKLGILYRYLDAYTTALKDQPFQLTYVDAFAGDGTWRPDSEYTHEEYGEFTEMLDGSANIALDVNDKSFDRFVFIEKDPRRSASLENLAKQNLDRDIEVVTDDANSVLPRFCSDMDGFDRAVVFLDPFATEVDWGTVESIAQTQKIDCWILFPLGAIARMMPRNREPDIALASKLDRVFGGRDHWQGVYHPSLQQSLFGDDPGYERSSGSDQIARCYRSRLESIFRRIAPTERKLRNSMNSPMFELFFAASNPKGATTAVRIADHILRHW